jgi:hypothetical protein
MKLISKTDREQMSEVIQGMFLNMSPIVCWSGNSPDNRIVKKIKIQNVDNETETLVFTPNEPELLPFENGSIFFFSEEQKMIFKGEIVELTQEKMLIKQPETLMLLEEADVDKYKELISQFISELNADAPDPFASFSLDDDDEQTSAALEDDSTIAAGEKVAADWFKKVMSEHDASLFEQELSHVTLEEEDELFEGVRSSPRAKPPEGKMLTVQIKDESRPQSTFTLYDLSRGGLSFLVFSKDEFSEGETLFIRAFDVNKFESPIEAEVKVVREADEMGIQYKIGCEFISAQNE